MLNICSAIMPEINKYNNKNNKINSMHSVNELIPCVQCLQNHVIRDNCDIDECRICGYRDCPSKCMEHYWHDGCPYCSYD